MENREAFSKHDELSGVGDDSAGGNTYDAGSIETFHNLVSHDGSACNKQAPELMMQALVAIFLLR